MRAKVAGAAALVASVAVAGAIAGTSTGRSQDERPERIAAAAAAAQEHSITIEASESAGVLPPALGEVRSQPPVQAPPVPRTTLPPGRSAGPSPAPPAIARPAGRRPVIRVGLVLPGPRPLGGEARATEALARRVVDEHNLRVDATRLGRPLALVVLAPEEVSRASGRIDVFAGGYGFVGAPRAPLRWILPASDDVQGPGVIGAEPGARRAGDILGRALRSARAERPLVGVITTVGADPALGNGLAAHTTIVRSVIGDQDDCEPAVERLRRAGVTAVALVAAVLPLRRCAAALDASGWRPPDGVIVPPAHATAFDEPEAELEGSRTILGSGLLLGSVVDEVAGPNVGRSYRAVATYGALQLVSDLAVEGIEPSSPGVARLTRISPFYDIANGSNRRTTTVVAVRGRWLPQP